MDQNSVLRLLDPIHEKCFMCFSTYIPFDFVIGNLTLKSNSFCFSCNFTFDPWKPGLLRVFEDKYPGIIETLRRNDRFIPEKDEECIKI